MPHISIRVDQDLFEEIDSNRGNLDRTSYIKMILVAHFEAQKTGIDTQDIKDSNTDVVHLEDEIKYLKEKLNEAGLEKQELYKLLNQEQSLHLQTQKQLMSPSEEIIKKSWWKFWKS